MPRDENPVEEMIKKQLPSEEANKIAAIDAITRALYSLGFDSNASPSTYRTPERFVNYLLEFFQPYSLASILGNGFDAETSDGSIHGMIVQSNIPFTAVCEHHLLPMQGSAYIGYVPNDRVVGLSKMTRLVYAVGHERPGLQEAMTEKLADAMYKPINSKGSIAVIRAQHGCMSCRGVNAPEVLTVTSRIRGVFRDSPSAREEFLYLSGLSKF